MNDTDSIQSTLLGIVTALVGEIHPAGTSELKITLDSELDRELGLDSLARMELLTRLEREFSIHFPEKVLASAQTPRDLLRSLRSMADSRPDSAVSAMASEIAQVSAGVESRASDKRHMLNFSAAASLPEVLYSYARTQPEIEHITLLEDDREFHISYLRLWQEAMRVAAGLHGSGLERGDTVAIMLPTSAEYFYCFMGVMLAGGIPVPLYPPARPTQIEEHVRRHRRILANAGARILITVPEVRAVGRLLKSQVPELAKIVVAGELASGSSGIFWEPQREDIAFIQYTSGSTGDPKGVVLTHGNLLANIAAMGKVCRVTTSDRFVSWLPLYHDMGLIGAWFGSMCHGCRLVVMSPLAFLARPVRWLRTIEKYGGTLSASPNFGFEICATRIANEDLAGLDLSSWRLAFNGAEPVLPATLRKFVDRFAPYGFSANAMAPVYGLAESTVGLAFPEPGTGMRIDRVDRNCFTSIGMAETVADETGDALEFVCCGRPLPGHQLRVVDSDDRELPERQEGRLQFKGPSSTGGYYRNAEQNRKLFCGEWLETGDLAYMVRGEIYLTSRQKDIIIRAGRNIYPHELEEVIGEIDGIRKGCTAVFATRDSSDSPDRLVVLTESRLKEDGELLRMKKDIVSATMDLLGLPPDEIVIAGPGTVLKTSSGKIRRAACRMLYESGHVGQKKAAVWLQLLRMALAGVVPTMRRLGRRMVATAFACYCWLSLCLVGAAVWCAIMVVPAGRPAWKVASSAVRFMLKITGIQANLVGGENWPDGGRFILVSNHTSYIDSIVLTGILPQPCNFVGKAELGRNWFLSPALKKLEVHLVERFDAEKGVADARAIGEAIHKGSRPLFFAEGTLQRMPGLLPFQLGAFVLASEERLPIIPIVISGTRNILRGGSWFPRRGIIRITICSSCTTEQKGWQGAIELKNMTRHKILTRLGEPDLSGEYRSLRQVKSEGGKKPVEERKI
ncbi:AMP-binding protein [Desulfosediminicola sp.]|uniref:AMP-binding protein n=1 Tax=Desulfosediminicola sp. TaxID=2886825 RepID=UPI003AF2C5F3